MDQTSYNSWSFNVFAYDLQDLEDAVFCFFEEAGLIKECAIDPVDLKKYIAAVKDNYEERPYHNFRHAVEVTHFIYMVDKRGALRSRLNHKKRLYLFLAALNHDIAHPGKTAKYQKMFSSELYEKYGDTSLLEKYHTEVACALLEDPSWKIVSFQDKKGYTTWLEALILSTDMQLHTHYVDLFKKRIDNLSPLEYSILLLKCADLSQLIRGKEIGEKWVFRLRKELYLEKAEDMQRKHQPLQERISEADFFAQEIRSQQDFIDQFAYPLYEILSLVESSLKDLKQKMIHKAE